MNGTEKQIEWATKIKATWHNQIVAELADAQARVADKSMPSEWAEVAATLYAKTAARFDAVKNAKTFIDNRNFDVRGAFQTEAAKLYNI